MELQDFSASSNPLDIAQAAADVVRQRTGVDRHEIALVLGSGWSGAAGLIGDVIAEIPAADVPGFAAAPVAGHSGTVRSLRLRNSEKHAFIIGARTHLYEGLGVRRVVHGVRTAAALGAKTLVLTNGCGGLNPDVAPGTPVLISDHINLTATSPLEGATFVDLTDLYSARLREVARTVDGALGEGVYVQFPGPHYETPAEVQMARFIGGDLVGMSTALEAIAAREAGLEVLGLSLGAQVGAGWRCKARSHEAVVEAGVTAGSSIAKPLAQVG